MLYDLLGRSSSRVQDEAGLLQSDWVCDTSGCAALCEQAIASSSGPGRPFQCYHPASRRIRDLQQLKIGAPGARAARVWLWA